MNTLLEASVAKASSAPTRRQTNPPNRILVVDDDVDLRKLNTQVLVLSGYQVNAAEDGEAAWEYLKANSCDLLITDNRMPRLSGLELVKKLRSAHMTLPVIMATGHLPTNEFMRKPWLKPEAMLQRPFTNDDLLEAVKKVLRPDDNNDGRKEALLPKHL